MGGLARRVGYEKALSKHVGGEVPVLHLDAGHMFTDQLQSTGIMDDPRVKNEWMLRAYDAFGVAAANVSSRDLPYLSEVMAVDVHKANVKKFPMLSRLVSANVAPANGTVAPFEPYRIAEVSGGRVGAKPIRVGILGVTAKPKGAPAAGSPYTIADPVEAARKYVPELRAKCDLLVILAYTDRETANRIGNETKEVDLVLAAHQFPIQNGVDEAGDAVVAYIANETRWIGEIRLYREEGAKEGPIASYFHRNVPLDRQIPDDPAAAKMVTEAREKFSRAAPPAKGSK